ncbi:hypothetical protein Tco_1215447 [Tanacetum coccineum]
MKCPQYYLTDMQEVILFYNGLDIPTRQILNSRGAIPTKIVTDAKVAIQEMAEYSQKWHNGTSSKNKRPHYTKDCPHKEEGKTLEEAYYTQFGTPYQPGGQCRAARPGFYQRNNGNSSYPARRDTISTETNPRDQVKSISTTIANLSEIRRMVYGPYAVSVPQHIFIFLEAVPFPRRLYNYCCDDWKEARGVKILEA